MCCVQAPGYLNELLISDYVSLAVDHLLASVGATLRQDPCVPDTACRGIAGKVHEAFAEVMHACRGGAGQQAAFSMYQHYIVILHVVPYTR